MCGLLFSMGITFPRPTAFGPGPRPHLLFYGPRSKLLFRGPHLSKLLFHIPKLSKLIFHGPVGRKYFLYFCIVKVSNFSIVYIASPKIPEREGSISPSNLYWQLPDYWPHVFSLIYPVDECSFKEMKTWGQSEISFYCFLFGVN